MKKILSFLFALLLLAPVTGELFRIPIMGQELLPSDLIIPPLFFCWLLDKLKSDRNIRVGKIGCTILFFLLAIVLINFLNLMRFDFEQMIFGFIYLGRFAMYVVVALMTFDLLQRDKTGSFKKLLLTCMFISMALITLLGFLQLKYFPSFLELNMQDKGWDPHVGRLLSTWFDPNFVGGYLGFMLPITLALALYFYRLKKWKNSGWLGVLSIIGLIALYLTFSRSGYLTLITGLGLFTFFKSRRLLVLFVIFLVLGFSLSTRVQERTISAFESAKSLVVLESQKPMDPTSAFRVDSWKFAGQIIEDYPVFGAGYGRYANEFYERGRGSIEGHSSGGSDSSLLTLWAQTGLIGLLSYLAIIVAAVGISIKVIWKKESFDSYLQLGLLCGLAGLMIHSFFVNSLLFALMMVYFWAGLALMDRPISIKNEELKIKN